ncbi:MAG: hypothetical protein AAFX06_06235 [Planctomycetota bacterium]
MFNGLFAPYLLARSAFSDQAESVGRSAHSAADRARSQAQSLESDVEKLFLISQALWSLLKEQHGYTDEDLLKRVTEIDLLDGKLDGKLAKLPVEERPTCQACGRKLMGKRQSCMYCGETQPTDPFTR